jgi:hypothetical protein
MASCTQSSDSKGMQMPLELEPYSRICVLWRENSMGQKQTQRCTAYTLHVIGRGVLPGLPRHFFSFMRWWTSQRMFHYKIWIADFSWKNPYNLRAIHTLHVACRWGIVYMLSALKLPPITHVWHIYFTIYFALLTPTVIVFITLEQKHTMQSTWETVGLETQDLG